MMSQTGKQIIAIHILYISQEVKAMWKRNPVSSWSFSKNQNWAYLWFNCLKLHTVCFYCTSNLRSGTSFLAPFSAWFLKKNIFTLYPNNWPILVVWITLLLDTLLPGCDVLHFEISLSSLIKSFSYWPKKSGQKLKYLENEKSF